MGDFDIWKVHERVFQVGEIPINVNYSINNFFEIFVSLLNKGNKFIPCFYFNEFHFFVNLLTNFENNFPKYNNLKIKAV